MDRSDEMMRGGGGAGGNICCGGMGGASKGSGGDIHGGGEGSGSYGDDVYYVDFGWGPGGKGDKGTTGTEEARGMVWARLMGGAGGGARYGRKKRGHVNVVWASTSVDQGPPQFSGNASGKDSMRI